jgi:thymidylate synthase (FAD)
MKVELIAYTALNPEWEGHPEWKVDNAAEDGELLIEFAGRTCYQSYPNSAGRTNKEYIQQQLIGHGHGSVLEHASATFFITGVSRAFTHELIRHRHLSFSELSQRYVDLATVNKVEPPAVEECDQARTVVGEIYAWNERAYRDLVSILETQLGHIESKTERRKKAREAARCVMPNCTETRIVVTGNFRAWRGVLDQRATKWADAEMREVVVAIGRILKERFPAAFGDYQEVEEDGVVVLKTEYRKV